jgi:serine protease Do
MGRFAGAVVPLAALALTAAARAEDPAPGAEAAQLQRAAQAAIRRAEPSIACVLVSRSDAYRRHEVGSAPDTPGRLGGFAPPPEVGFRGQPTERERALRALDLSNPATAPESFGSGVVIDPSGLVLTCAHVVRNATKVYVRLPGGKGSWADIHAADPRSDLAVLKLIDPPAGLTPARLGDGGKAYKGQFVVGLANPFAAGFRDGSPGASWGIVSNLRRRAPGDAATEADRSRMTLAQFATLLQTDVRLDLGCSGGALVNLDGEVIGLTTAVAALTGTETPGGFALPLDDALRRVVAVLARGEEVEYGFLGVQLPPDGAGRGGRGVRLGGVIAGSPAERAGVQPGDLLVGIDGREVRDADDLFLLVGSRLVGDAVRLTVERPAGGPRRGLEAKLTKYYVPLEGIASRRPPAPGGLRVDYASVLVQRGRGNPWGWRQAIPDGVVIREVVPNSPADRARLQPDKVITKVNGAAVHEPADFYRAMAGAGGGEVELAVLTSEGREERVALPAR